MGRGKSDIRPWQKAESGEMEMALSDTDKQHPTEATLDPNLLKEQGAGDAVVHDQQHEHPALNEKGAIEENAAQGQHNVSTATTLEERSSLQQWNHPKMNVGRSMVAFYGLIIMGANDAAYGVSEHQYRAMKTSNSLFRQLSPTSRHSIISISPSSPSSS